MKLSGRQLAIMRVLWDRGEATVAEVQQAVDVERTLAYSTVATVMSRLEEKGVLTHRAEGRVFHYRAVLSEDNLGSSVLGELVNQIFGGSPAELVSQLLNSEQIDSTELDRIKQLVRQHENRISGRRSLASEPASIRAVG